MRCWPLTLLLLTACSGGSAIDGRAPAPGGATAPAAVARQHVTTELAARALGRLGSVLVDDTGRTLYTSSAPCDLTCLDTWPLALAAPGGPPAASGGVQASQLATAAYDGLTAVTYAGHALHAYVGDAGPGGAAGQGVQGTWAAVTVAGTVAAGTP